MTNDDKPNIEEVNAAYQELARESSPPEIDARILQAAKQSLEESPAAKKPFPYQRYSIAASVCLSVMLVSFYLNNPPLNPASIEAELKRSIEVSQEGEVNDFQQSDDALLNEAEAIQVRAAPQAAESVSSGALEEIVIQAQRSEAVSDANFSTAVAPNEPVIENLQMEELVILNASAIAEFDEFAYRSTVEGWLLEIEYLLEFDEVAAEEEIDLFSEAYPEIEVESALNE